MAQLKPKVAQKSSAINTTWIVPNALCWIDTDPPLNASSNVVVFEQATVLSYDQNEQIVTVKDNKGVQSKHKINMILERAPLNKNPLYNGFEDMVDMETLNDAELLNNIIVRFSQDLIFTYVGPTLLVVNPFKGIKGMFEPEVRNKYAEHIVAAKGNPLAYKELQPHVYAVAAEAYRSLFDNEKNQAIVISGESGAGKTENAKFCMNLLTSIGSIKSTAIKDDGKKKVPQAVLETLKQVDPNQPPQPGIEDKILGCNPILESFGNAKTVRNNNSSRFGKYVRIVVNQTTRKIKGAEIVNYLLEKSRITTQGINERNFHIFYHMLAGLNDDELTRFQLRNATGKYPPESFNYLKSSNCYTAQGINDVQLFREIQQSIQVLGFQSNYDNIFSIVSCVLQLGNVEIDESTFGNDTPCSIKDKATFAGLAGLVKMTPEDFSTCMTMKQVTVQKQIIYAPLPPDECRAARDSLSKEMYDRLFNWLVLKLNENIAPQYQEGLKYVSVGLLDIYGFEVFEKNGFEQMMINYTNEKLHQLYISYVFKEEERVFAKEGLQAFSGQIVFHDNNAVIELLDKPPTGIFKLLDESCTVKSTDESLLNKIKTCHKTNPLLVAPKMPSNPTFIVVHTAKDVEYTIFGFRDKNKDEMSQLAQIKLGSSQNDLLKFLFQMNPEDANKKADKFLASKIKKEMVELMNELNSCDVHFVRCIKPNEEKVFNVISQNMTLKQIRYLGVLDSLKVRKESYPIRRNYQAFYKRYGDITRNKIYAKLIKEDANFRELVIQMFKDYFPQLDTTQVLMGDTRIFLKTESLNMIEEIYKKQMAEKNKKALKMQKAWRVFKMKKALKRISKLAQMLRTSARAAKERLYKKKQLGAVMKIEIWWAYVLKKRRTKKYKDSSKLFQLFIKRYFFMAKATKQRKAVEKIQKMVRVYLWKKDLIKRQNAQKVIEILIDKAWAQIRDNAAVYIQRMWRGHMTRKKNKHIIKMIKEALRLKKLERSIVRIQRSVRIILYKRQMRKIIRATQFIQGYFRRLWLSDLFQRMRIAAKIIQRHVRNYLAKRRAYNLKYQKYILPLELEINEQRLSETNALWLSRNDISPLNQYSQDQAGVSYSSPNKINQVSNQQTMNDIFTMPTLLDQCLMAWKPKFQKMCMFMYPIDIDILCDLNLSYNHNYSYSRTLLNILIQQIRRDHPVQSIHLTEQSTVCVTVGGGSIYEFGENKLFGRNSEELVSHAEDIQEGVEKITFPESIRIRSIQSNNQHLLAITQDGTLLQYGDPTELWSSIDYKPWVHQIQVQSASTSTNVSFAVTTQQKMFSWPIIDDEVQLFGPVEIRISHKVKCVSSGNQFAVMLCENGLLYSWGENLEGELGLGDNTMRSQPQIITALKTERIAQLSCGFKHVAVKTTLNRMFTWGWGEHGQLGHQDFKNEFLPRGVYLGRNQALWISCGRTSTMLINDKRAVQWCGSNSTLKYQSMFQTFRVDSRVYIHSQRLSLVLNQPHYVPVRVLSTYSKTMEITYVTYANVSGCLEDNHNKRNKLMTKLVELWSESPDPGSVDPPFHQQLANHIYEISMRKPGIAYNRNYIYQFFKNQQIRQQEDSDLHYERIRSNFQQIFARNDEPTVRNLYSLYASTNKDDEEQDPNITPFNVDRNTKLAAIKQRLKELETQPQEQWSDEDIEFIKIIYQSKVNKLLQSM